MSERRRDGDRQWRQDLEEHDRYPFAHQVMLNRVMLENVALRERFENRITSVEKRVGLLENFRGQVTLLGGIGFLLLGVVLAGLFQRIFGLHVG